MSILYDFYKNTHFRVQGIEKKISQIFRLVCIELNLNYIFISQGHGKYYCKENVHKAVRLLQSSTSFMIQTFRERAVSTCSSYLGSSWPI